MEVQLVIFKEDGVRRDFDLKRTVSVIGRAGDCDFQIPLAVISRRHCQITRKENRVIVKDLGSSNGTYINNKRVLQAEVHAGDTLTVGPVVFTILIDGQPKEIKPVPTILKQAEEASISEGPTFELDSHVNMEPASDGSSLDLANLDNMGLEDDVGELDLDDSAVPGPLAELEALAKQRKK